MEFLRIFVLTFFLISSFTKFKSLNNDSFFEYGQCSRFFLFDDIPLKNKSRTSLIISVAILKNDGSIRMLDESKTKRFLKVDF